MLNNKGTCRARHLAAGASAPSARPAPCSAGGAGCAAARARARGGAVAADGAARTHRATHSLRIRLGAARNTSPECD